MKEIINFFDKYELKTLKKDDFKLFCEIIKLMEDKQHLNKKGLIKISQLASKMNRKVDRVSRILRDYTSDTQKV